MPPARRPDPSRMLTPGGYAEYRRTPLTIAGRPIVVVSKQGTFSHGRTDPASVMLARQLADTASGEVVADLNCGNGMAGTLAALAGASRVFLADRNVVNADAARRTVAENGATNAEVMLGHGAAPLPEGVRAGIVAIRIPKERVPLRQLIADAFRLLDVGGRCYVAGATNEGIRIAATTLERIFGSERTLARDSGHHLLLATKRSASPHDPAELDMPWGDADAFHHYDAELRGHAIRVCTRPGVFSWEHLDEATSILAGVIEVAPGERVLDIGCGAGALGTLAGLLSRDARVLMLDADVEAVRSAQCTAAAAGLANAEARTSDVGAAVGDERFDVVVTNPPFHVGKATDLDVPMQFIADAFAALVPGGRMYLVANRTLPYERAVKERFGNVETLHDGVRFKVLRGVR